MDWTGDLTPADDCFGDVSVIPPPSLAIVRCVGAPVLAGADVSVPDLLLHCLLRTAARMSHTEIWPEEEPA